LLAEGKEEHDQLIETLKASGYELRATKAVAEKGGGGVIPRLNIPHPYTPGYIGYL